MPNINFRKVARVAVAILLVSSLMIPSLLITQAGQAHAAVPAGMPNTLKVTPHRGNSKTDVPNTDGNIYTATVNNSKVLAYCLEVGADEPKTADTYTYKGIVPMKIAAILDAGYSDVTISNNADSAPGKTIHGVNLTAKEAHEATQIAIWLATHDAENRPDGISTGRIKEFRATTITWYTHNMDDGNTPYPLTVSAEKVITAAKWLADRTPTETTTKYAYYTSNNPNDQTVLVAVPVYQSYIGLFLTKQDDSNHPLANATFRVRWYNGQYTTQTAAEATGNPAYTWYMKTDANGQIIWDSAHYVSGSQLYKNGNSEPAIPVGTVLIDESQAPDGYIRNTDVIVRQITGTNTNVETVNTYNAPVVANKKICGGVKIQKVDADWARFHDKGHKVDIDFPGTQGNASMANAEFKIYNASGNVVATLVTNDLGQASTAKDALPFGDYIIKETRAPEGYNTNPIFAGTGVPFKIAQEGYVCFTGTDGFVGIES